MAAALVDLSTDRGIGPLPEGDSIRASVLIRSYAYVSVDPTTVSFRVRKPDRSVTTHTYGVGGSGVTKLATGRYYLDVALDDPGTYIVRAECAGTYQGAAELRQAVAAELV
jgi:hypothetical protein